LLDIQDVEEFEDGDLAVFDLAEHGKGEDAYESDHAYRYEGDQVDEEVAAVRGGLRVQQDQLVLPPCQPVYARQAVPIGKEQVLEQLRDLFALGDTLLKVVIQVHRNVLLQEELRLNHGSVCYEQLDAVVKGVVEIIFGPKVTYDPERDVLEVVLVLVLRERRLVPLTHLLKLLVICLHYGHMLSRKLTVLPEPPSISIFTLIKYLRLVQDRPRLLTGRVEL
jgi:hypothetical protein